MQLGPRCKEVTRTVLGAAARAGANDGFSHLRAGVAPQTENDMPIVPCPYCSNPVSLPAPWTDSAYTCPHCRRVVTTGPAASPPPPPPPPPSDANLDLDSEPRRRSRRRPPAGGG